MSEYFSYYPDPEFFPLINSHWVEAELDTWCWFQSYKQTNMQF